MGKKSNQKKGSQAIWVVAGIAVVAVAALVGFSLTSSQSKASKVTVAVKSDKEYNATRNVMGPATAKVTLVEYNDYL